MGYKLPSLNALRAFEAASRLRSITRAANELCVTQGAISRHIHILEESLAVKLFFRLGRGIELTPAGASYLDAIQDVFQKIDAATRKISGKFDGRPVRISAAPTLMSRWLVPRLPRFKERYPDISLNLETAVENVDFGLGGVDLAIETHERTNDDIRSVKLFDLDLVPICSPTQVDGHSPPKGFDELRECTLLHTLTPSGVWEYWSGQVGFSEFNQKKTLSFQTSDLAYQAALDGLGVALGVPRLLVRELSAGTLMVPIDLQVRFPGGYFLNVPKLKLRDSSLMNVFNWLIKESGDEIKRDYQ